MTSEDFSKLDNTFHEKYIGMAYDEAVKAATDGEVPAGCIIVAFSENEATPRIVGKAHNMTESLKDPTAHAEVLAITQAAAAVGNWRISNSILYVTKEPCPMCGGAIVLARIPFIVWAIDDPKRGAQTVFKIFDNPGINHHPTVVSGICREKCLEQLQSFFKSRRT